MQSNSPMILTASKVLNTGKNLIQMNEGGTYLVSLIFLHGYVCAYVYMCVCASVHACVEARGQHGVSIVLHFISLRQGACCFRLPWLARDTAHALIFWSLYLGYCCEKWTSWLLEQLGTSGLEVSGNTGSLAPCLQSWGYTYHSAASCLSSGVALGPEWVFSLIAYLKKKKKIK